MDTHKSKRRVLVTGGTGSVGRALVESFSRNGDLVTFQYNTNETAAAGLRDSLSAKPLQIDFRTSATLPHTDFDVLVNNAGINISKQLSHDVTRTDWDQTFLINVTVPFLLAQQCLPHMLNKRWGRIINVSSIYGLRGVETNLPYTASKHALSGLTKTIAKEYAEHNITCNEICPGPIESDMMTRVSTERARLDGISLEAYLGEVRDEIPAGRMARPAEIASLALFLASPEAAYVTGASIPIDGGMIA